MNDRIERLLASEATSDSRGYVGEADEGGLITGGPCLYPKGGCVNGNGGARRWHLPTADVEAPPLASVAKLLELAKS